MCLLKGGHGNIKYYFLPNLHDIHKSNTKYHTYGLSHFEATTIYVDGASIAPGYCCLPLLQAVTSQAGHIKHTLGPFFSLVDIEN